jgi:hypothetical protein
MNSSAHVAEDGKEYRVRKSLKITTLALAMLPLAALTAAEGMLGFEALTAITNKGSQAGNWSMEMGQYDAKGESMGPEMAQTMCVTPEQMEEQAKMMGGRFAAMESDPACKQSKGLAADGKMDYAIACDKEGKSMAMSMTGTYSPTESNMTIAMNFNPAREGAPAKMQIKAKRLGDCAA